MTREADTNAKIVMLMKTALAETKHCRNEQQRQEFHIGLSYVMPLSYVIFRALLDAPDRGISPS